MHKLVVIVVAVTPLRRILYYFAWRLHRVHATFTCHLPHYIRKLLLVLLPLSFAVVVHLQHIICASIYFCCMYVNRSALHRCHCQVVAPPRTATYEPLHIYIYICMCVRVCFSMKRIFISCCCLLNYTTPHYFATTSTRPPFTLCYTHRRRHSALSPSCDATWIRRRQSMPPHLSTTTTNTTTLLLHSFTHRCTSFYSCSTSVNSTCTPVARLPHWTVGLQLLATSHSPASLAFPIQISLCCTLLLHATNSATLCHAVWLTSAVIWLHCPAPLLSILLCWSAAHRNRCTSYGYHHHQRRYHHHRLRRRRRRRHRHERVYSIYTFGVVVVAVVAAVGVCASHTPHTFIHIDCYCRCYCYCCYCCRLPSLAASLSCHTYKNKCKVVAILAVVLMPNTLLRSANCHNNTPSSPPLSLVPVVSSFIARAFGVLLPPVLLRFVVVCLLLLPLAPLPRFIRLHCHHMCSIFNHSYCYLLHLFYY